jgi:large subunit ribosomal protein L19
MNILEKTIINAEFFYKKENLPKLRIGDNVKVTIYLELPKIEEAAKEKERIQVYEGVIISKHSNRDPCNSTITVRKMFQGGGIEKVFLLNSPWVKEIKNLSSSTVRRGKLYYLRDRMGKSARLKRSFK